jgi:hypothetical protein
MRRLLGLLRKDDDPRALVLQPGLDQLAALVDSMRSPWVAPNEAGVECVLHMQGEPIDLTPGIRAQSSSDQQNWMSAAMGVLQ